MSKAKGIGRTAVSVLLWIIILLAALFAFVTLATKDPNNVASIGGVTPLSVESNSMAPTFEKGDLILIKKCDTTQLKEGDIVTYHTIIENQYVLNTHRIVEVNDKGSYQEFVTKGDNNGIQDSSVIIGGDIVGKYFSRIPKLGYVMTFLSGKIGFFVIIVLPLLIFFIYEVYHLVMVSMELKKANAIEAAIAEEEAKQQISVDTRDKEEAAEKMQEEAAKALEEAKRMQAEAEAALAKAKEMQEK